VAADLLLAILDGLLELGHEGLVVEIPATARRAQAPLTNKVSSAGRRGARLARREEGEYYGIFNRWLRPGNAGPKG
jgi:hypothetical protein